MAHAEGAKASGRRKRPPIRLRSTRQFGNIDAWTASGEGAHTNLESFFKLTVGKFSPLGVCHSHAHLESSIEALVSSAFGDLQICKWQNGWCE
jgi:hypothetical protein